MTPRRTGIRTLAALAALVALAALLPLASGPLRAATLRAATQPAAPTPAAQRQALDSAARRAIADSIQLERMRVEIAKLTAEKNGLEITNSALGMWNRRATVWVPVLVPILSAAVAAVVALLVNRTVNAVQTKKLEAEDNKLRHETAKLVQEKELARERHLLDVSKELGNASVGVRGAAIATLVQRLAQLQHATDARSAADAPRAADEASTIIGLLVQASKHEDDEPTQKYIADGLARALGALPDPARPAASRATSPLRAHDFQGARLTNAWWKGIDARAVDFYKAKLTRAGLREARLGKAILKNADLAGATLVDADLEGADLSFADLTNARLAKARLAGANLSGADLRGARLGEESGLLGATLTGAHLRRADLQGTGLTEAELAARGLLIEDDPPATPPSP